MLNKLKQLLLDIGLAENESMLLIVLFQEGGLKVSDIAKKASLNRTTTYGIIKSLSKRRLIDSYTEYGIAKHKAIEPELLLAYVDRQQENLKNKKEDLKKIMPDICKLHINNEILPSVVFFEGIEGVKRAYEDTLTNNKSKKIHVFSGPDAIFKQLGKDYIKYYVNKRKRLGIKCYQIASSTPIVQMVQKNDEESLRVTKLIFSMSSFDTEIVIYDTKIAMFSFKDKHLLALVINDRAISDTLKKIFDFVYSILDNELGESKKIIK